MPEEKKFFVGIFDFGFHSSLLRRPCKNIIRSGHRLRRNRGGGLPSWLVISNPPRKPDPISVAGNRVSCLRWVGLAVRALIGHSL